MIIRLIPPSPHPTILYGVTFPPVLYLHDICPGATIPAAWSSQLQLLASIHLEPPSNVHMLDRGAGLVARAHEVTMDVQHKEFTLRFVDGRVIHIPMNSDCVRMLLDVVVDVKACSEPESQRNSIEGSACAGSTTGSAEDVPPGTKPSKPGKHKRQRSLLFSLISLLVPKSFSLSSPPSSGAPPPSAPPPRAPPPPSSAPPPAPLPPLPVSGRMTFSTPRHPSTIPGHPEYFRKRARATLVEVWRRHVMTAVPPQHVPAAGYAEWSLIAFASQVRAEIETVKSRSPGAGNSRAVGSRHRRVQSEGRNALDFGDRHEDCEPEQWRCRAPSPFPGVFNAEDNDRVVYPRRELADEWGVRYDHSRSIDEIDIFAVEYNGHHDSRLGDHFTVGDGWDDTERLTLELMEPHGVAGIDSASLGLDDNRREFILGCSDHDGGGLMDMAFDMSRCPLTPSDVNDDEQSDDSQISLRTPEDGEDLPIASPIQSLQGSAQHAPYSGLQPSSVSRVSSSRPRSRTPPMPVHASRPPTPPTPPSPSTFQFDHNMSVEEFLASHLALLDRICAALEIVRSRAREEGWRLVRATLIGAKNGWMDAETEKSLEIKAKRRAWSSGIKISAPYSPPRCAPKVWDGGFSTYRSPMKPPGLASSRGIPQVRGPIVPTGLSLGIPVRSSPLASYSWGADDRQEHSSSKYGILSSGRCRETVERKRTSRVTFADSVTQLFPVCEDDGEDLFEPVQVNAVGFPQAVPVSVEAEDFEYSLAKGPSGKEDDPFYYCPPRPRTRTRSMYMTPPAPSSPQLPVLPMFRPSTPPPSYQVAVGDDVVLEGDEEPEGKLDASALLLQPLSSLSISPLSTPSSPRPLVPNTPFVSRPRSVSLPTPRSYSGTNKTRRPSFHHKDERCEDLSQAYASPPPQGPVVISATPAPHEQYPKYAHVHSPTPAGRKSVNASILGRTGKEVMFEQDGTEFAVGIEVALGRAEEGRVVW